MYTLHSHPLNPHQLLLSKTSTSLLPPRRSHHTILRCTSNGKTPSNAGELLSGMVGEQVEALLRRVENKPLLDGLEEASRRVDLARQALADIERQEEQNSRAKEMILQLQNQEAQIAESQRELLEARALVDEAERSLSSSISGISSGDAKTEEIDRDAERLESVKAAVISAIIGTMAGLPLSFYQATSSAQLVQSTAVIFISCFLFGATFRYAIRRDLDNVHLKTGTSAAFGVVKGLATMEASKPLEFSSVSLISHAIDGAVYVSESVLIFIFSAIALEFCFKTGLLSAFPIRK